MAHRQRMRQNEANGHRRLFPSFRTNGSRIQSPPDVPSWVEPLYDENTQNYVGREVVQLKRFSDKLFYLGNLFLIGQKLR